MDFSINVAENHKANYTNKAVKPTVSTGIVAEQSSVSVGTKVASNPATKELSITKENIKEFTNSLNTAVSSISTRVKFEYGDDINGLYINVIDADTDSIISRYPSEEAVKLTTYMKELVGAILDKKI